MILAANDVADAQVDIVGAGRHVISGNAVAAQQREILDVGGQLGLLAVDRIVKLHRVRALARHAKAQHEWLARIGAALAFLGVTARACRD